MPKNTVPAAGEAMPIESPILEIARRLSAVQRETDRMQTLACLADRSKDSSTMRIYDKAANHAEDQTYVLRELLSMERASSITDAAIQMAELTNVFDLIMDQVPKDSNDYRLKRDARAALRLMYSVMEFLDGCAFESVASIVNEHFGSRYLSPWATPESVVEAISGDNRESGR